MAVGILLAVLTYNNLEAAIGTVTIDYSATTGTGTPYVFGVCKFPMKAQENDIYPKLKEAGITYLRADFYYELIIPASKCASLAAYKNNVNGIQNPDSWDYRHLYWISSSRAYGIKTLVTATYVPTWLSCSGTYRGVPKDWAVWEDIVGKVYSRYRNQVDWIEAWNEIEYWCDLTGSPYQNREDFLVDYFYHTVKAIRDAGGTVPTGGFAFANNEPQMFQSILKKLVAKYGRDWTNSNFNFYSEHHYGADPGELPVKNIRNTLKDAGLTPDIPIFVDEWNYTADWVNAAEELHGARAIGYVGKSLTKFIKNGVNATYFSTYPSQSLLSDTGYEDGMKTTLSFYSVDKNIGVLLPQAYPFKILSNRLGLGAGNFTVVNVSNQTVVDACAAVNSSGRRVAFIANYYDSPNTVTVTIKGLRERQVSITEYWAATWDSVGSASSTKTIDVADGQANYLVSMPANTCVGLALDPPAADPSP